MICKEELSMDIIVLFSSVVLILGQAYTWCFPRVRGGILILKGSVFKCQLDGCSLLTTSKASMRTHVMDFHQRGRMSKNAVFLILFVIFAIFVSLLPMPHYSKTIRDVRVRPNEVKVGKNSMTIVRGKLKNGTKVYVVPWELASLVPSPYMQQLSNACKDPPVCKASAFYERTFNMLKWNVAKNICVLVKDTPETFPYVEVVNNTITHIFQDFGSYSLCIMHIDFDYCEFLHTIIEVDV